jgi:exosome complex component RRP4
MLVFPGDALTSAHAYMRLDVQYRLHFDLIYLCRGHGTYVHDQEVIASVAGTVERVNKLITVRAVHTRCV